MKKTMWAVLIASLVINVFVTREYMKANRENKAFCEEISKSRFAFYEVQGYEVFDRNGDAVPDSLSRDGVGFSLDTPSD